MLHDICSLLLVDRMLARRLAWTAANPGEKRQEQEKDKTGEEGNRKSLLETNQKEPRERLCEVRCCGGIEVGKSADNDSSD